MTSKTRRSEAASAPTEIRDAPDSSPRGPVAHVQTAPPEARALGSLGILEGKVRVRRAEALMARGEAYSLAAQLESLTREFETKRGELRRAWKKTQGRIQVLEASLEADEATLALLRSDARSTGDTMGQG